MFKRRTSTVRAPRHLGVILLGIWLILTGIIPIVNLTFAGLSLIMAILAIVAGVLIILQR